METVNKAKYQLYIFLQQNDVTKIMRGKETAPEDNIYNIHTDYMCIYMYISVYMYIDL